MRLSASQVPAEFDGLYEVVSQASVRELLEIDDDRYCAVLSDRKGCANSGLLAQQTLELPPTAARWAVSVCRSHRGHDSSRWREDALVIRAGGDDVTARHVVMCTNGFVDHVVRDHAWSPIRLAADQEITGRVAYMAAFFEDERRDPAAMSYLRNEIIGGDNAYVYVTRRTYDRPGDVVTLTCMGGPEYPFREPVYDANAPFPGQLLAEMDDEVRPFAQPSATARAAL